MAAARAASDGTRAGAALASQARGRTSGQGARSAGTNAINSAGGVGRPAQSAIAPASQSVAKPPQPAPSQSVVMPISAVLAEAPYSAPGAQPPMTNGGGQFGAPLRMPPHMSQPAAQPASPPPLPPQAPVFASHISRIADVLPPDPPLSKAPNGVQPQSPMMAPQQDPPLSLHALAAQLEKGTSPQPLPQAPLMPPPLPPAADGADASARPLPPKQQPRGQPDFDGLPPAIAESLARLAGNGRKPTKPETSGA